MLKVKAMKMTARKTTALLILLSAVNLALMVPGGFVETRAFPDYPVAVIGGFNVFLTVLGLGALLLVWPLWRHGRPRALALAASVAFFAVYAADLAELFPVSTTPMPPLLFTLEWLGIVLALAALAAALAIRPATTDTHTDTRRADTRRLAALLLPLAGLGAAIVIFATRAATG